MAEAELPKAGFTDSLRILALAGGPQLAKGVILRREAVVGLLARTGAEAGTIQYVDDGINRLAFRGLETSGAVRLRREQRGDLARQLIAASGRQPGDAGSAGF